MKTSAILLAGGSGARMNNAVAKQYLELHNKPLILYSYEVLLQSPEIDEIVVVCSPDYQRLFATTSQKKVSFALPGPRRQDSVYNGFMATSSACAYVCVHDGARPFLTKKMIADTLEAAKSHGAATVGVPIRYTVKEVDADCHVKTTADRSTLREIQTPQVIKKELLAKGFAYADLHKITVTDDVSLAELVGNKVKLVEGSYQNIKITVPSDMLFAHQLIATNHA